LWQLKKSNSGSSCASVSVRRTFRSVPAIL
jgi:hypothetical protein